MIIAEIQTPTQNGQRIPRPAFVLAGTFLRTLRKTENGPSSSLMISLIRIVANALIVNRSHVIPEHIYESGLLNPCCRLIAIISDIQNLTVFGIASRWLYRFSDSCLASLPFLVVQLRHYIPVAPD